MLGLGIVALAVVIGSALFAFDRWLMRRLGDAAAGLKHSGRGRNSAWQHDGR